MVNSSTDFFQYVDNFAKIKHISSIEIICKRSNLIPQITIAIPTYKRSALLKDALDSALNQTFEEFYEVIVVDNNPERNDETEKLLAKYTSPLLSYYKNEENIGMAGNWNRCFSLAKGRFVVMLHDDDILLPEFLSYSFDIIKKIGDIGIFKPKSYIWNTQLTDIFPTSFCTKKSEIYRLTYYHNMFFYVLGAPSGCIFDRCKVIEIGGFNEEYMPSIDYCFLALFSQKYKVYTSNQTLSIYRIAANESLNINTHKKWIYVDYYLRKQMLGNLFLPSFICRYLSSLDARYRLGIVRNIELDYVCILDGRVLKPYRFVDRLVSVILYHFTHNVIRLFSKNTI